MEWTLLRAKQDFERGLLKGVFLSYFMGAWQIKFICSVSSEVGYLVDARTKKPRNFKTSDAAFSLLRGMGFRVAGVNCIFER